MTDNISSIDPNLVFGDLFSRLHLIQTGTFNYLGLYHPPHQMHPINDVFKLNTSVALSYLELSISKVEGIQTMLDDILSHLEVNEEPPAPGMEWYQKISKEEVKARVRANLESELATYLHELNKVKNNIAGSLDILEQENPQTRKIKLKLSVEQFGALIRLLSEVDLLDEPVQTELCRILANSFKTKKGGPTPKSLQNAMTEVYSNGFDFWKEKLPEMQGMIQKLRK